MLTRACHARDWAAGVELSAHMLGQAQPVAGAPHLPEGAALQGRLHEGRGQRDRELHLPDAGDEPVGSRPRPGRVPGGVRGQHSGAWSRIGYRWTGRYGGWRAIPSSWRRGGSCWRRPPTGFLDGLRDGAVPELPAAPSILDRAGDGDPGRRRRARRRSDLLTRSTPGWWSGPAGGRVPVRADRPGGGRAAGSVRLGVAGWPAGGTERTRGCC